MSVKAPTLQTLDSPYFDEGKSFTALPEGVTEHSPGLAAQRPTLGK